ncbi:hypothetical protein MSG28_005525 [Choristoneura fumiferana]|uniref:Uncharacterized protein n=3 Tax=Choristoneura fumiferana TaxID=7141 RepID=A0ACC0KZT6_CHOFU|nr:hypothetical protein MSG28_005525 [Choristoneura fumiferana]KAI8441840.1 hypothetical protein MSG28_005525 [Choristoneura fumiferana]KAI8441841.1 hypothetical protein MSG28_005525 [Choristoneura fumiferana]
MAPPQPKAAAKPAAPPTGAVKKAKVGKPRNYDLGNGVVRFSKSKMFHKKALYKFVGKKNPKAEKPKKPSVVVKQIGGDKNGGSRTVLLKKRRIVSHPHHKSFSKHVRRTRPNLTVGTVCILLAGRHAGKRVVLAGECCQWSSAEEQEVRQAERQAQTGEDIFATKKDARADRKSLRGYLKAAFGLRSSQFPHRMRF